MPGFNHTFAVGHEAMRRISQEVLVLASHLVGQLLDERNGPFLSALEA